MDLPQLLGLSPPGDDALRALREDQLLLRQAGGAHVLGEADGAAVALASQLDQGYVVAGAARARGSIRGVGGGERDLKFKMTKLQAFSKLSCAFFDMRTPSCDA